MILGLGRAGVRRIAVDDAYAMDPTALGAAIAEDRAAGIRPAAIVATVGTTGSNAIDPVAAVADIAAREGVWLHVDAAYAGVVALLPDRRGPFAGWERADSIVVNPHKWLFTPLDCSLLLCRRPTVLRDALSLVPEYLRTTDQAAPHDFNEYQPQLGRRFRALKIWFVMRYFGLDGLRARIAEHLAQAATFAAWVDGEPGRRAPRARALRHGLLPLAPAGPRTTRRPWIGSTSGSWSASTRPASSSSPTRGWAAGSPCGWPSATCAPSRVTWNGSGSSCVGSDRRSPRRGG